MDGVLATRVGYTGGAEAYPTYERIGGHTEAVQVEYDPSRVSYEQLLNAVWASGAPRRPAYSAQYKGAIWWHDDAQRAEIERRVAADAAARRPNQLTVAPLPPFFKAEEYHQQFVAKQGGYGY